MFINECTRRDIHFHAWHPNCRVDLHSAHCDHDERFQFELFLVMIQAWVVFRDKVYFAHDRTRRLCVCAAMSLFNIALLPFQNDHFRCMPTRLHLRPLRRIPFNSSSGEPSSALPSPSASVLRINHYRLKSLSHTHWRFKRDSTFRLNDFDNPDVFPESEEERREWIARWDACCEEDHSALKYRTCIDEGMKARSHSREAYNRAGEL